MDHEFRVERNPRRTSCVKQNAQHLQFSLINQDCTHAQMKVSLLQWNTNGTADNENTVTWMLPIRRVSRLVRCSKQVSPLVNNSSNQNSRLHHNLTFQLIKEGALHSILDNKRELSTEKRKQKQSQSMRIFLEQSSSGQERHYT